MAQYYGLFLMIHMVFGLAMIVYIAFPAIIAFLRGMQPARQVGLLKVLNVTNRIGQFLLLVQFFSGGMLMSHAKYSIPWMATITGLLIAIGAFTGIMGKPLKLWKLAAANDEVGSTQNKVLILSLVNALAYAVILYLMYHPSYR